MNPNDERPRRPRPNGERPAGERPRQSEHSPRQPGGRQPGDRPRQPGQQPRRTPDRRRRSPQSSRRPRGKYARASRQPSWLIPAIVGGVLLLALIIFLTARPGREKPGAPGASTGPGITQSAETLPPAEEVVSTVAVGSMGDLVMHRQLVKIAEQEDKSYNFDYIFRYMGNYVSDLDCAAVNLETSLGGPDCGTPYQGNPRFNTPDALLDSLKKTGYDMILTANNHCGDTQSEGVLRTLEQVRSRGLTALGTYQADEAKRYTVTELDGIKLGMVNYTFAANVSDDGRPSLNAHDFLSQKGLVNFFTENRLDNFYQELSGILQQMRDEGADFTLVYLHWGREYELGTTAVQRKMAQKLSDMGVDVIIGSHPHVVEPMELVQSQTDPGHKMICLYSMGNFVSNQRRDAVNMKSGHTEDGMIFTLTFEQYSDGRPYLLDVDVLPVWVKMGGDQNKPLDYAILPLDSETQSQWQELYALSDSEFLETQASYRRTMDIVGPGLLECKNHLAQQKAGREQYYWDLANHPEKFAAGAATAPAE